MSALNPRAEIAARLMAGFMLRASPATFGDQARAAVSAADALIKELGGEAKVTRERTPSGVKGAR